MKWEQNFMPDFDYHINTTLLLIHLAVRYRQLSKTNASE